MPKPAAQDDRAAVGVARALDLFDDGIDELWPEQVVGPVHHGQYGNIAALLARNQCILGHNAPPFFSARRSAPFIHSCQPTVRLAICKSSWRNAGTLDSYRHFIRRGHGFLLPQARFLASYFWKYVKRHRTSSSA